MKLALNGTLGEMLRSARRARNLTIEELSARAGIGVRTLGDLERNRITRPHRGTIDALAGALGLSGSEHEELWTAARPSAVPRESRLIGRDRQWRAFDRWFASTGRDLERAGPVVITGPPGAGKTAFATEIFHVYRDRFPGGRFVLDVDGLAPADVIGQILRCAGGPVPEAYEDRLPAYRELMARRSMFVGLDGVCHEAQVRPLLTTGTPGLMVITGRGCLGGLDAGYRIALPELSTPDAIALLERMTDDPARILADPAAAAQLVRLCGHLPLALRVVATKLGSRPGLALSDVVTRLRPPEKRLTWLASGDLRIRDELDRAYGLLDPAQQRTFRTLCALWTPVLTTEAAAVALGVDAATAEDRLEELVDAGMLTFGDGAGRYRINELLRIYGNATGRLRVLCAA